MCLETGERGAAAGESADDEKLFRHLRLTGDQRTREELVRRFLPLARKLASRYTNPYEPFEDLVQVASIGLLGAIDRFDLDRGVGFPSFAIPTILGELKRHFRRTGWSAHVPRRAQELALAVDKAAREMSAATGASPSVEQLAHYLELDTEDVLTGLDAGEAHYSVSLDAVAPATAESDAEPLLNTLGREDDGFGLTETEVSLAAVLKHLPQLEAEALSLRLTRDLKQTEIADLLGCSQMQVSRLLRRAAANVREQMDPSPAP
ncbi:MAG: sigma-70 family RNA polymerase sigma factor [Solirubrobacteraceae bacterium]